MQQQLNNYKQYITTINNRKSLKYTYFIKLTKFVN